MPGKQITPPISLSQEQKIRLHGFLHCMDIVQTEINDPKKQIEKCQKVLVWLEPLAGKIAKGADVPRELFQAMEELKNQIKFANSQMDQAKGRLADIQLMLNGEHVDGWGEQNPFQKKAFSLPNQMIYLILQGEAINLKDYFLL